MRVDALLFSLGVSTHSRFEQGVTELTACSCGTTSAQFIS
jgi:hypothetical protein